jgi:hypothetical protein
MSDPLDVVRTLVDLLFGLTCLGAPFLLWNRSKNAALLGAAAGAVHLFTVLVDFVLGLVSHGPTPPGIRLAYILISGTRNLLFYGCLFGMVMILARGASDTSQTGARA